MMIKTTPYWLIPLLILLALGVMSCASQNKRPPGLTAERLAPCPGSPNCVSSEEATGTSRVDPLVFTAPPEQAWASLKRALQHMGGSIEQEEGDYLWATFKTRTFRFVDDVEFRLDAAGQQIQLRSASRVGYSDMGLNRKRVEVLRQRFALEHDTGP
jgi:uncharacterized protein (DUF1499 family)